MATLHDSQQGDRGSIEQTPQQWNIVDDNGTFLDEGLCLSHAESLLCRYCNEDIDAYLQEVDHVRI